MHLMISARYPEMEGQESNHGPLSFLHPFIPSKKTLSFRQRSCIRQPRRTPVIKSQLFTMSASSKAVPDYLYFGYGSNMSRTKMRTRGIVRKDSEPPEIEFTDVWIGRLSDWQLCMNMRGSPPIEPAFGNIRPCKGDEVYGVVYRLKTESSWEKLKRTEGVRKKPSKTGYLVIQVDVECFSQDSPSQKTIRTVNTLVSFDNRLLPRRLECLVFPSSRYMNLLISGAKEEGLPQSYVRRLELMPVARVWANSFLSEMGLLLSVLYINMVRSGMDPVLKPFRMSITYLYAFHESFARKEDKKLHDHMGTSLSKLAMFLVYLIPNLVTLLLFVVHRRSWETYMTFRRMRAKRDSPKALTTAKAS